MAQKSLRMVKIRLNIVYIMQYIQRADIVSTDILKKFNGWELMSWLNYNRKQPYKLCISIQFITLTWQTPYSRHLYWVERLLALLQSTERGRWRSLTDPVKAIIMNLNSHKLIGIIAYIFYIHLEWMSIICMVSHLGHGLM